jgi:pyruvate ferredoxin oxidoreductase beta subunit
MSAKTTVLNLPEEELMQPGNRACAGCGLGLIYRTALKALGKKTILVVPPSCLTVLQGVSPVMATSVPCLNVTFASTAASATGIAAGLSARKKTDVNVVAFAGDGGTGDIGIQGLSGACERGDDIIYICYDNEAYMNTGIQRSGTTPKGVITTTTPYTGKPQAGKDVPAIVAAHNIDYVATASASYPTDLCDKVKKAMTHRGVRYLHVHTPCPAGWGFDARLTVKIGQLAVESGMYALYEIENGVKNLTGPSRKLVTKKRTPVKEYLATQARFRSLNETDAEALQTTTDAKWEAYKAKFSTE